MTPTMACPCGVAVLGMVEDGTDPDTAIAAYERAAFQALAVGARFYVRYHDTGHGPAEAAPELDLIARQSRIVHVRLEQQLVQAPPAGSSAPILAGLTDGASAPPDNAQSGS